MYILCDPPLVLCMLTSWQLAAQLVAYPHASAEEGLGLDSNGQSPGQKTNVLPLCLRPGYLLHFNIWSIVSFCHLSAGEMVFFAGMVTLIVVSDASCCVFLVFYYYQGKVDNIRGFIGKGRYAR